MTQSAHEIAAEKWFAENFPALYAARLAEQANQPEETEVEVKPRQNFVPMNRYRLPRSTTKRGWR